MVLAYSDLLKDRRIILGIDTSIHWYLQMVEGKKMNS